MSEGITLKILGDFGPFSRIGKSIGYQVNVGQNSYLIDCGAPIFHLIGGHGLKKIVGLIVTHCHDDHKRWFSDLALFHRYAPDFTGKVPLITTELINEDLKKASAPSLSGTLSKCGKQIVDIPYDDFIDHQILGPREKYQIVSLDEGGGKSRLSITDRDGNVTGPDVAKILINQKTGKRRMLFKDPEYGEWIEPESFYSFASNIFYEENKNIFRDKEGFEIEALKAPVWHGIPGIGLKIKTDKETLTFSSDTANDKELWRQLYTEKRKQRFNMPKNEFESASVLYGDINDYIERTWSEERYQQAINAFNDAIVVHDLSVKNSIVHTDYEKLENAHLNKDKVLLTHSPDRITSEWTLSDAGKTFRVKKNELFEEVGSKLYRMNADIYHKESGRFFVGYKDEKGKHGIYEKDGLLRIFDGKGFTEGNLLYKVTLYEDISGKYFPNLNEENSFYVERKDGRIELVEIKDDGSTGKIVKDLRDEIHE
tara:strand:+ start:386 stop:1834 length:1449 start_codon:yes stop_codon:yes gene_type:complete